MASKLESSVSSPLRAVPQSANLTSCRKGPVLPRRISFAGPSSSPIAERSPLVCAATALLWSTLFLHFFKELAPGAAAEGRSSRSEPIGAQCQPAPSRVHLVSHDKSADNDRLPRVGVHISRESARSLAIHLDIVPLLPPSGPHLPAQQDQDQDPLSFSFPEHCWPPGLQRPISVSTGSSVEFRANSRRAKQQHHQQQRTSHTHTHTQPLPSLSLSSSLLLRLPFFFSLSTVVLLLHPGLGATPSHRTSRSRPPAPAACMVSSRGKKASRYVPYR